MLELVQQRQLASPDDAFYVSTGRWYTHNCSEFEAPLFNRSMWALSTHYQVRRGRQHACVRPATPADSTKRRRARASTMAPASRQPSHSRCFAAPGIGVPPKWQCQSLTPASCSCPVSHFAITPTEQNTKGDWPHVFFGVPPFDHTTCAKAFDYKTAAACPAAGNGTSPDMYNRIASYAHTILEK